MHRILSKKIRLSGGAHVDLKYWAEGGRIFVAGFDPNENMVTRATYSAEATLADELHGRFRESLIDSLVNIAETDLLTNPELHYRPAK
jgi:hypothetical protein